MAELVRDILIDATPETIWPLLTDATQHVRWQGTEADLDPRPGGVYRVLVAGQFPAVGEFVEVVAHERIVYTWGWDTEDNPVGPGSTRVEWTLIREGDKTRVQIRHSELPDDDAVAMHTHGWDHYLARLAIAGVGGDAGPDTGPGGDG